MEMETKKKYLAVFLSSFLFGSAHLINLALRPNLAIFTIAQALYTMAVGIFFAAVYLRSSNLWAAVFFHTLSDIATGIFYVIIPQEALANSNVHYAAETDQSIKQGMFLVFCCIPMLLIALHMLKKVPVKEN